MFKQSLTLGWVTAILAIAAPLHALEVKLNPTSPELGDTISVFITTEDPNTEPTVTMDGDTFPAYPLAPNYYRALLPTSPLDDPGRVVIRVSGEGETRNLAVGLRDRSFPTQRIWLRGGGSNATQLELDRVAQFKTLVTPEKYWNGALVRPTSGPVSTIFGVRRYYNGEFAHDYYHRGVDYAAGRGTPVVAPAAGRISLIGRESQGFRVHGNTVGIDHGQGVLSIMLHLNRIDVQEGDFVEAGQRIGTVGSTGASTGPHLHWGLYVHGIAIDPVPWRYEGLE
ncbi:M23 family metallopeptidase [Spirulina sp. CS-785/01]|uniref:M23 family metallopeptidase n=1 Tax=Spirulina sp. CS-785/01 TaxID=3021716 RepID=UPI00232B129D|nr:M23 family metallopeptidase [Spirulina sp. CS-785/01]MDB9314349.1 M23 family metallopeptidase [Spirulina sp. CS-785/01]